MVSDSIESPQNAYSQFDSLNRLEYYLNQDHCVLNEKEIMELLDDVKKAWNFDKEILHHLERCAKVSQKLIYDLNKFITKIGKNKITYDSINEEYSKIHRDDQVEHALYQTHHNHIVDIFNGIKKRKPDINLDQLEQMGFDKNEFFDGFVKYADLLLEIIEIKNNHIVRISDKRV